MKLKISIFACFALAGCSGFGADCKSPDAAGIVAALATEAQLKSMIEGAARPTQTFTAAQLKHGADFDAKFDAAVDAALDRHSPIWKQNLTKAWSSLTAPELKQVCDALTKGDRATFEQFAGKVGPVAQAQNRAVLVNAGSDVLEALDAYR